MNEQASPMQPEEFRAALAIVGLSISRAAPLLGISVRQARRWAAGTSPINLASAKLLRLMVRGTIPVWQDERVTTL